MSLLLANPVCRESSPNCTSKITAEHKIIDSLPASLGLGAVLARVPLLLAVEALHGTPWVVGAPLRIGVDVGVAILCGAAAAAPGIGSGGVVSPRIVVRHLRVCMGKC